jgi:hypothetical protein
MPAGRTCTIMMPRCKPWPVCSAMPGSRQLTDSNRRDGILCFRVGKIVPMCGTRNSRDAVDLENRCIYIRRKSHEDQQRRSHRRIECLCACSSAKLYERAELLGAASADHYLLLADLSKHVKNVIRSRANADSILPSTSKAGAQRGRICVRRQDSKAFASMICDTRLSRVWQKTTSRCL